MIHEQEIPANVQGQPVIFVSDTTFAYLHLNFLFFLQFTVVRNSLLGLR